MALNVLKEILGISFWWNKSIQSWDESFSKVRAIELHSLKWITINDAWIVDVGRFTIKDKICEKFTMFSKEQVRYIRIVTKLKRNGVGSKDLMMWMLE
jgi:hypothetical protein